MNEAEKFAPRGGLRLLTYYDEMGLQRPAVPLVGEMPNDAEAWKRAVETLVHVHAGAGVDAIVKVVWSRFTHQLLPSVTKAAYPVYEPRPETDEHVEAHVRLAAFTKAMHEAGHDMVAIMIEQAHRDGLAFIAGLRMNDRHPIAIKETTWLERPEWHLKLGQEGAYWEGGFDYSKEGVREGVLAFVADMLDHYDVDGIEYDWMRFVYVFPTGTEQENAPLLTDFHRRTRDLVDKASSRRGCKLTLGVRVPHVLGQCLPAGFDVATWIREGLVDYVVPSHFGHMDPNARIEDFRKLTEGGDCRVYPSLQGHAWTGPCRLQEYGPQHYYAVARNWYAGGADGLEIYNYQFKTLGEYVPRLSQLTPLRDPRTLAEYDRDYLFWRLRGPVACCNEPAMQYDVIHLDRAEENPRGAFSFRLAEDLMDPKLSATMEFKAVGMTDDDAIEVTLNGETVAPDLVDRTHVWDGTGALKQKKFTGPEGEVKWIKQGDREPYDLFRFPLGSPPMVFGDNELAVGLTACAGDKGVIRIEEVDIKVHVA